MRGISLQQELEAVFDVKTFTAWLAINSVAGNWDAYGQMTHNYYLYADPANGGRLTWIPWDHDLSLQEGRAGDLLHTSTTAAWPHPLPARRSRVPRPLPDRVTGGDRRRDGARVGRRALHPAHDLIAPFAVGDGTETGERPGFTFLGGAAAFQSGLTDLTSIVDRQALRAHEIPTTS
jgi:spore coat protein H